MGRAVGEEIDEDEKAKSRPQEERGKKGEVAQLKIDPNWWRGYVDLGSVVEAAQPQPEEERKKRRKNARSEGQSTKGALASKKQRIQEADTSARRKGESKRGRPPLEKQPIQEAGTSDEEGPPEHCDIEQKSYCGCCYIEKPRHATQVACSEKWGGPLQMFCPKCVVHSKRGNIEKPSDREAAARASLRVRTLHCLEVAKDHVTDYGSIFSTIHFNFLLPNGIITAY